MKKIFPVIVILSAALLLGGCARYEDMIPETLGEPEGLWLYRGTERSRTDGSETEPLFDEIVLDGETYTAEEYTVCDYLYCTDEKTAFFVLEIRNSETYDYLYYSYFYNYAEKAGRQLGKGTRSSIYVEENGFYVYFSDRGYQSSKKLYTRSGEWIEDFPSGYDIVDDVLWSYVWHEEGEELVWWKAGEYHSAMLPKREGGYSVFYDGEYLYDCSENSIYAVHSETAHMNSISYDGTIYEYTMSEGKVWFLTYTSCNLDEENHENVHSGCKLYRISGMEAELIYTFKESWSMKFRWGGNIMEGYIELNRRRKYKSSMLWYEDWKPKIETYETYESIAYYLNLENGKLKKGTAPRKEFLPEKLVCGEYTFWVENKHYGFVMWLGGECSYLYRSDGEKTEIMQYEFIYSGRVHFYFYDDICDF